MKFKQTKEYKMQIAITMGNVQTKNTVKGAKYSLSQNATAHFSNGDKQVTVMAFGEQRETVLGALRKGRKTTLTAVWDGKNVLKLLGPQREEAPAEAA